jgi:hypothetical protein
VVRENRKIYGDDNFIFPYQFQNNICVLATTTNVNPRNVVGYIYHIIKIPLLGGDIELGERFTLTNKFSKIILSPQVSEQYLLKFRFAGPVGNCQVKIWEYVPPT